MGLDQMLAKHRLPCCRPPTAEQKPSTKAPKKKQQSRASGVALPSTTTSSFNRNHVDIDPSQHISTNDIRGALSATVEFRG